ncbi:MAG: type I DNA topoisomerase, partial [Verrucomicrobiota bacterium]
MPKSLVIVESPTKARTLSRFLGDNVKVVASMGHVRDLPQSRMGVDVENSYKPSYVITDSGKKTMSSIRKEAKNAECIYLATDHDREGEAIAWHLHEILKDNTDASFHRVTFHEITRSAILDAFENPGSLDFLKVDAQQARRVLDRLVGYKVSPLLWRSIKRGTSAGRVQSVALRLVCERERAIQAFEPVEYWDLIGHFGHSNQNDQLSAKLTKIDGKKARIGEGEQANQIADELEAAPAFRVVNVTDKPRVRKAPPPFITSTLQQSAGSQLNFNTRQAMQIAQQLYEGIELGAEGATGLITYMRTDSVTVSKEAQETARTYIRDQFGDEYVPEKPNQYRSKGGAQEAHEAIRPTDPTRSPEDVAAHLSPQQLRMYRLIWRRFMASQMTPARFMDHIVELSPADSAKLSHDYLFHTRGTSLTFAGHLKVYGSETQSQQTTDNAKKKDGENAEQIIPDWAVQNADCELRKLERNQCFTKPPQRFSEATLVRELERNGVGRPSTYASIVSTIQQREYVARDKGRMVPTDLGFSVNDFLMDKLDSLFNVDFTARMEKELDQIEEGEMEWQAMLDDFYTNFRKWLAGNAPPDLPPAETVRAFLDAFDKSIPWEEPEQRGKRVFDDAKFTKSLVDQLDKGKSLSEKQWVSILNLAAKYADRVPALENKAEELGIKDQLDAVRKSREDAEKQVEAANSAISQEEKDRQRNLIQAFADVTFAKPVKRGNRQYDDAKFIDSLKEQIENGKPLTAAQTNALRKMAVKYREQIPDYEQLKQSCGLQEIEGDGAPSSEEAKAVLEITKEIDVWANPTTRGRKTYNDEEFVNSLKA